MSRSQKALEEAQTVVSGEVIDLQQEFCTILRWNVQGSRSGMIFYIISILVTAIDQISKYLIRTHFNVGDAGYIWKLQITRYENSGMALSLFQGYGRIFALAAVLFVIGVLYYRKIRINKETLIDIGLGFLVGGALGNAIDRILYGHVTDFLVSRSGKGILNLADYAINIGILLILASVAIRAVKWRWAK